MNNAPPSSFRAITPGAEWADRVLLLAGTGFLHAYAGTLYLARELQRMGCDLTIWVSGTAGELAAYEALGLRVVFFEVRGARGLRMRLQALRRRFAVVRQLFRFRRVIVTESTFLFEAALAKGILGADFRYVQYSQELLLSRDYPHIKKLRLHEMFRLARFADLTVDVEPHRAHERMRMLRLPRCPLVLRNTLPKSALPPRAPAGRLAALSGVRFPPGVPILLYMGGVGKEKPMERVVEAVAACRHKVFFLAFCTADTETLLRLRSHAASRLSPSSFAILAPRPRNELLSVAWEADVGIVDYSPAVENTCNQRFCAPTKLYEFMASGLALVGSDNNALREIIEGERIGCCAAAGTPQDLGRALEDVIRDPAALAAMKTRALTSFQDRHCYEILCAGVVREIACFLSAG